MTETLPLCLPDILYARAASNRDSVHFLAQMGSAPENSLVRGATYTYV